MKSLYNIAITFTALSIMGTASFAQSENVIEHGCTTEDVFAPAPNIDLDILHSTMDQSGQRAAAEFPVRFIIVSNDNGSAYTTREDLDAAIANMNNTYAPLDWNFYIAEIVEVNSNFYSELDTPTNEDDQLFTNYPGTYGMINVYLAPVINSLCGRATFPWSSSDYILISGRCVNNGSSLDHEAGHYFGLYHTHSSSLGAENVARTGGQANCTAAGDLLCDTEADPVLGSGNVNGSCIYTGTGSDGFGVSYTPDVSNMMSYAPKVCRNSMTAGQMNRANNYYISDRTYLTYDGPICAITSPAHWDLIPSMGVVTISSFTDMKGAGSVTQVDLYVNGVLAESSNSAPYDINHNFASAGVYKLHTVISDNSGTTFTSREVSISVGTDEFSAKISASNEDAEENLVTNSVLVSSTDLEIGKDADLQMVGLSFDGVLVDDSKVINYAYIKFWADEKSGYEEGEIEITGEKSGTPLTFSSTSGNISSRTKTSTAVSWIPANWSLEATSGDAEHTADVSSIINEIIAESDWVSGNRMNFYLEEILSTTAKRTAYSYNGNAAYGAELYIYYSDSSASSANIVEQNVEFNVYPNPVDANTAKILIPTTDDWQVSIVDLSGRLVFTQKYSAVNTVFLENLDTYAKGYYTVIISNGTEKGVEKLIIQ